MKALLSSKRGAFCLILIGMAFVLVLLRLLAGDAWASFAKYIALILVTGHTATGALETWSGSKNAAPVVPAQPIA